MPNLAQIEQARTEDYKTLGRFLGLAEMAEESGTWKLSDSEFRKRAVEILQEYRANQRVSA